MPAPLRSRFILGADGGLPVGRGGDVQPRAEKTYVLAAARTRGAPVDEPRRAEGANPNPNPNPNPTLTLALTLTLT